MDVQLPKFENPKDFFVLSDALHNLSYDIDFSVFKKYKCHAGCKICYIREDWIADEKFSQYVDTDITPEYIEKIQEIFSYFEVVTAIDDIYTIKDKFPEQYKFYLDYSHLLYIGSISDNAIFRYAAMEDEARFKGVREISVSTQFLTTSNIKKLIAALDNLASRYKILQFNILVFAGKIDRTKLKTLLDWCADKKIDVKKHFEISDTILDKVHEIPEELLAIEDRADGIESKPYSEGLNIFPVQAQLIILMLKDFYCDLKSATREDKDEPFASVEQFDPMGMLTLVLKGKLATYTRYSQEITDKESPYYRYYSYIAEHLIINDDYTFIPKTMLKPYSVYYKNLVSKGIMIETRYGLLKAGTDKVISIVEFSDKPIRNINQQKVFLLKQV